MEVDAETVVMEEKVAVHEDSFNRKRGSGWSVLEVDLSFSSKSNNNSE